MRLRRPLSLLALLLLPCAAVDAADLSKLLQYEADIIVSPRTAEGAAEAGGEVGQGGSLLRLVLPPAVVAKSRADLSDVRVFDRAGNEVPFVVDSGLRAGEVREASEWSPAKVLDVRREQSESDERPTLFREEYEVEAPPAPELGSRWELLVDSDRRQFVRSVEVAGSKGSETTALVRDGTIFRLPQTATTRASIVLPPFAAERLRLTIEGADGGFLEPRLSWRSTSVFDGGERAVLPLEVLSQRKENGRTVVEVGRPDGVAPDVIRLETSTPSYYRTVDVFDVRQGSAAEHVGAATVFRVKLRQPVEQAEIRLGPTTGDRVRLEIRDEDSPELQDLKVFAVVRQPVLFFDMPPSEGLEIGVLRFGGGRVERARYDLEQLSPAQVASRGQVARLGTMLLDRTQTRVAELRDVRPNPGFDPSPLLAFAMQPGAVVDVASYAERRAVHVADSPDGLSRLRLQPEDLAAARADLGDLRVVGADGRQWPYLLHRRAGVARVELGVGPPVREKGSSRYDLRLPFAPLPLDGLEVKVDRAFYSRPYRLVARAATGDERVVAQGKLSSANHGAPAAIALDGARVEALRLIVEDGDEAPIPVQSVAAEVAVPDLYLVAPGGDYALMLGAAGATAPRYDLADARDAVLSVASVAAGAGALEPNPSFGWRQRWFGGREAAIQRAVVWGVLGAAVLALALITVRLVRKETPRVH